jgi:hypothetical protein
MHAFGLEAKDVGHIGDVIAKAYMKTGPIRPNNTVR